MNIQLVRIDKRGQRSKDYLSINPLGKVRRHVTGCAMHVNSNSYGVEVDMHHVMMLLCTLACECSAVLIHLDATDSQRPHHASHPIL